MEMQKSKVYVLLDSSGYITRIDGGYTIGNITAPENWVLIDEGNGDKYNLCQGNYFPQPIRTMGGAYRYKLIDGMVTECSESELLEQESAAKIVELPIAPRNIVEGEYITVGGVLYKATDNIPAGERIITGQNAIKTTYEEQLYELKKGE